MALILHKEEFEDEGDAFYLVSCKTNGETPTSIPDTYTFETDKTDAEMEAIIVPNLTEIGYTDLSPVTWEE